MAGKARNVPNRNIPDPRFQVFTTNESSYQNNTQNVNRTHFTMNQYIRANRGIFSGAFGSLESNLTISSGILLLVNSFPILRTAYVAVALLLFI